MEYVLIPPENQAACLQALKFMEGDWSALYVEQPLPALWFWEDDD